jgi:serine/threonine-protein kinase
MADSRARFQAAMDLVDRALDLSEADRAALLVRECADLELRATVERLLRADANDSEVLSGPAIVPPELSAMLAPDVREEPGALVGAFRLVSILGKGGMGEVWVAERMGADFEQKVALKLLPPGDDELGATARFRRERQILARLSHPRIARFLDGGVTPDGRAWLAMELVEGLSLVEHCKSKALDVDARLRLFVEVCDGVQFAHANLVVHRDLKPTNVLIDANGNPKLLDFGIAKLLADEDDATLTHLGDRPMTPDYAAPEQVRGEAITTATDVWALGVILHELLTGLRPFRTFGKTRSEIERAIVESTPTRPSSLVTDGRKLSADLDAIVLKTLRREPEERYGSVFALAADVRRYLDGAAVEARGGATGYLIRTTLRRHRVAFGFSALVVAALVAGLASTIWQARRAREEARKAEQAQEFLTSMLRDFDPNEQGGRVVTQSDILARGEARVSKELGDQPEVQARLLRVFAETWLNLGEYAHARAAAERALALQRRTLGSRSIEVAKTLRVLGTIEFDEAKLFEAGRDYDEGLSIAREKEGSSGLTVAGLLNDQAGVKRRLSDFEQAETLRRESLEIYRRTLGEEHAETLGVMNDLAVLLGDQARFAESTALLRRTCPLLAKARGENHPDALQCRENLSRDLIGMGEYDEADATLRDVVARRIAVQGEGSKDISHTLAMRARGLDARGRSEEAIVLYDDALARMTKLFGNDHFEVAATNARKARALRHAGRVAEAEALARAALSICRTRLGEDKPQTARARAELGAALLALHRDDEGRTELMRAIADLEKTLGPKHPDTAAARADLLAAPTR